MMPNKSLRNQLLSLITLACTALAGGCGGRDQSIQIKSATSTPIVFNANGSRYHGAAIYQDFSDGRRVYSGVLFTTNAEESSIAVTRDMNTTLLVGETSTVICGRPIAFVDLERILLIPGWTLPEGVVGNKAIEDWCIERFESVRGTELERELARFAISQDSRL